MFGYELNNNFALPGFRTPSWGAAPAGSPVGPNASRYGRGSEATGFIPTPPSLRDTSASAVGINLGNMDALQKLYDLVANKYVPGYSGLSGQESANISDLLGGGDLTQAQRRGAEMAGGRGVAGAPVGDLIQLFATDDQKRRNQLLGSQLLSGATSRGKGIMPFENFFVTPQQSYESDWLAKQLQSAPDPAAAYNLNISNAQSGLNRGQRAGYGGGGPGQSTPFGGYGGNMITGTPNRVDDVVRKYSPNIQPTQPSSGGWGETSNSNGGHASNLPFDYLFNSPSWDLGENGWEKNPAYTVAERRQAAGLPLDDASYSDADNALWRGGNVIPGEYVNALLNYDWANQ